MIFEQKVRLVSPFAAAEVLVKDTEALALRRASVLEELHPGAAIGKPIRLMAIPLEDPQ